MCGEGLLVQHQEVEGVLRTELKARSMQRVYQKAFATSVGVRVVSCPPGAAASAFLLWLKHWRPVEGNHEDY